MIKYFWLQTFEILKKEDSASESEDLLDGMQRLMILSVGVLIVMFSLFIPLLMHSEKGVETEVVDLVYM